jgi:hypothetical protein
MEMLRAILDDYHEPTFEDLCSTKGIDLNALGVSVNVATEEPEAEEAEDNSDDEEINFDDYDEDDDDIFSNGNTAGSTYAVSPSVVSDRIRNAAKNW